MINIFEVARNLRSKLTPEAYRKLLKRLAGPETKIIYKGHGTAGYHRIPPHLRVKRPKPPIPE